ncbi:MAG: hypothetical protein LBJ00_10040 [Planctomycetaceae bacterium]|nr:hypothetical protein [Planctomycetaceae bacterium]
MFGHIYSRCPKIRKADYTSVASRNGCSMAKPTTHNSNGITDTKILLIY